MREYVVSCQSSYPDGIYYVELETGGRDYPSPGMLDLGYKGESIFSDPRDAAKALIEVRDAWQTDYVPNEGEDDPQTTILVSIGTTGGGMFSHDPKEMTNEEIIAWGEKEYERLPKCDRCGEIRDKTYTLNDYPDMGNFCSSRCADVIAEDIERSNQQFVIEHIDDYSWWNQEQKAWMGDPDDATIYWRDDIQDNDPRGDVVNIIDARETYKNIN